MLTCCLQQDFFQNSPNSKANYAQKNAILITSALAISASAQAYNSNQDNHLQISLTTGYIDNLPDSNNRTFRSPHDQMTYSQWGLGYLIMMGRHFSITPTLKAGFGATFGESGVGDFNTPSMVHNYSGLGSYSYNYSASNFVQAYGAALNIRGYFTPHHGLFAYVTPAANYFIFDDYRPNLTKIGVEARLGLGLNEGWSLEVGYQFDFADYESGGLARNGFEFPERHQHQIKVNLAYDF